MFVRYVLRTTDVAAGRAFYREAIGLAVADGRGTGPLEAWPLHERARAAGAPAHWLGMIATPDIDRDLATLLLAGAQALGPTVTVDGARWSTLRDQGGAVVALREGAGPDPVSPPAIAWHQLHTVDAEAAWATYAAIFGWVGAGAIATPEVEGGHRLFSGPAGGAPVGSMANTARWPGVHSHWMFHFPVDDLDGAVSRVRALGGRAMEGRPLPGIGRLSACEDAQGAAFGLLQR